MPCVIGTRPAILTAPGPSVRDRDAEPDARERYEEDRALERAGLRPARVPGDENAREHDHPELDPQRALVPVAVVAGHRRAGGDEHRERDQRALPEAARDRPQRLAGAALGAEGCGVSRG